MNCIICENNKSKNIIYSNEKIIISIAQKPFTSGHLQIFPKKHVTILEQLSNEEAGYLINAANKLSIILYSTMNIQGTNILINNGTSAGQEIPHFCIDIIPRRENDGLLLDWNTHQSSNESLESIQRIISENIVYEENNKITEKMYTPQNNVKEKEFPKKESSNLDITKQTIKNENLEEINNNVEKSKDKIEENKKFNYWLKNFERIP